MQPLTGESAVVLFAKRSAEAGTLKWNLDHLQMEEGPFGKWDPLRNQIRLN